MPCCGQRHRFESHYSSVSVYFSAKTFKFVSQQSKFTVSQCVCQHGSVSLRTRAARPQQQSAKHLFSNISAILFSKQVKVCVSDSKCSHQVSPLSQVDVFGNELEFTQQRFKNTSTHRTLSNIT